MGTSNTSDIYEDIHMTINDQEAANEDFDDTLMSAVAISTM